jgi:5-methylcytosine-specific restriction endonuclease McrBC GTP-binding regulatory subunit McrB
MPHATFKNEGGWIGDSIEEITYKTPEDLEKDFGIEGVLTTMENPKVEQIANALKQNYNIILRGAPGTGKSYLAKQIAAAMVDEGEEAPQTEFVQFHPSYDYTDFVEGLRPVTNEDGSMGFERQDGVFARFVKQARANQEDVEIANRLKQQDVTPQEEIDNFLGHQDFKRTIYQTLNTSKFKITSTDSSFIHIYRLEN